jgi:hypothetical protein
MPVPPRPCGAEVSFKTGSVLGKKRWWELPSHAGYQNAPKLDAGGMMIC